MMNNGSGTLVPPCTTTTDGTEVPFPKMKDNSLGGTEVPLPKNAKIPLPKNAKIPLPKNAEVPYIKHSNLPHIDIEGYYQFITFRTFDSVDEYLKKLHGLEKPQKLKQQAIDDYLDNSTNGAYLNDEVLEYLYDFFISKDKKLYELVAFCIMPNHVHLLFKPFDTLFVVMQNIKGATANGINKILDKTGKFWANDYYDKAIRDERHFLVVYEYIKNNSLKLGGAKAPLPNTLGGGTSVPHEKDILNLSGAKNILGNETLVSYKDNLFCGTEVPLPKNAKAPLPNRFYGIYEKSITNE